MSGGRMAHSRFHIPINVDETSHCSISALSDLEHCALKDVTQIQELRMDIESRRRQAWRTKRRRGLPEEILIDTADDPVTSIVDFTYPNILDNINDSSYFQEKAILAPTNEVVDNINEQLLEKFPGRNVCLSCDSVDKTKRNTVIDQSIFSPEFING
ncbi:ATP-dependent DNA helicase PIF1-like protein [Tanacetum coccineum]